MTRRGALLALPAALAAAALMVVAGCGGSDEPTAAEVNAAAAAIPIPATLNGVRPPGQPSLVTTSTEELSIERDGMQVRVYRDVRAAGTRSPIHVHGSGGWTCVVAGKAILFVDGSKPQPINAGDCVNMPPLTPMSNYNPGPGPSVLLDSFVTPPGADVWRIVEKGYTHLGNEFAHGGNTTQTNPSP